MLSFTRYIEREIMNFSDSTGNKPIIDNATDLFGKDITKKIGDQIWGLDKEGEFMNTYRPTGQRGLWFVAGPFAQGRFFSKHLVSLFLFRGLKESKDG